jgi:hypothetical protein
MDITTLALAKAYTDEEIKKAATGVDLSEYAKLKDIPTIQDIINALPKAEEEEF